MHADIFAAIAGIALVDIVLSGDNALVIGAAAGKLPRTQRLIAIIWGGLGAVILRILLAIAATELLRVPLLQAAGGVVLFFVAIRLLLPEREQQQRKASDRLWPAIVTILLADVTMSLDNVIAVGALAAGHIELLIGGIMLSMLLLFIASTVIARLMDYFSWLLDVAALVLGWTAANLILEDPIVGARLNPIPRSDSVLHVGFVGLIILIDLFLRAFRAQRARAISQERAGEAITDASSQPDEAGASGASGTARSSDSEADTPPTHTAR